MDNGFTIKRNDWSLKKNKRKFLITKRVQPEQFQQLLHSIDNRFSSKRNQ